MLSSNAAVSQQEVDSFDAATVPEQVRAPTRGGA